MSELFATPGAFAEIGPRVPVSFKEAVSGFEKLYAKGSRSPEAFVLNDFPELHEMKDIGRLPFEVHVIRYRFKGQNTPRVIAGTGFLADSVSGVHAFDPLIPDFKEYQRLVASGEIIIEDSLHNHPPDPGASSDMLSLPSSSDLQLEGDMSYIASPDALVAIERPRVTIEQFQESGSARLAQISDSALKALGGVEANVVELTRLMVFQDLLIHDVIVKSGLRLSHAHKVFLSELMSTDVGLYKRMMLAYLPIRGSVSSWDEVVVPGFRFDLQRFHYDYRSDARSLFAAQVREYEHRQLSGEDLSSQEMSLTRRDRLRYAIEGALFSSVALRDRILLDAMLAAYNEGTAKVVEIEGGRYRVEDSAIKSMRVEEEFREGDVIVDPFKRTFMRKATSNIIVATADLARRVLSTGKAHGFLMREKFPARVTPESVRATLDSAKVSE